MRERPRTGTPLLRGIGIGLGVGLVVLAGLAPRARATEAPDKALKRATKALAKQASFVASVECQGGLSDKPTRLKCTQRLVRRNYDATLVRPVLKIQDPEAFVIYGTHQGTIHKGRWLALLSTDFGAAPRFEVPAAAQAVIR